MNSRLIFAAIAAGVLSACQPAVPDSGRGVGFDNSLEALRQREAALARSNTAAVPAPSAVTSAPLSGAAAADTSAAATAAETSRVLAATRPGAAAPANSQVSSLATSNSGVEPLQASPSNPAPEAINNSGISDENDFGAVSDRQSIESDAARIANNRAQYEVVQPEALPSRSGEGQPNIVAFALETNHPVGQKLYTRSGFNRQSKFERNCAGFASADQAQTEFLSRGGPDRDRKGLDPDGDGYACSWDPSPFRKAAQG